MAMGGLEQQATSSISCCSEALSWGPGAKLWLCVQMKGPMPTGEDNTVTVCISGKWMNYVQGSVCCCTKQIDLLKLLPHCAVQNAK